MFNHSLGIIGRMAPALYINKVFCKTRHFMQHYGQRFDNVELVQTITADIIFSPSWFLVVQILTNMMINATYS